MLGDIFVQWEEMESQISENPLWELSTAGNHEAVENARNELAEIMERVPESRRWWVEAKLACDEVTYQAHLAPLENMSQPGMSYRCLKAIKILQVAASLPPLEVCEAELDSLISSPKWHPGRTLTPKRKTHVMAYLRLWSGLQADQELNAERQTTDYFTREIVQKYSAQCPETTRAIELIRTVRVARAAPPESIQRRSETLLKRGRVKREAELERITIYKKPEGTTQTQIQRNHAANAK